jgi:hypothetical protein
MGHKSPVLQPNQIEAAQRLYSRMSGWQLAERTLDEVARRFPAFDEVSCLAKVATLNALYATQVYAIMRMAEHVGRVMEARGTTPNGPDLVERLANLPTIAAGERSRRHTSFASKFAHFFVDRGSFPLFDQYAVAAVAWHLGKIDRLDAAQPYVTYAANCVTLRERAGFRGTVRELDHYLWLAGLHRAWSKGKQINREARRLFEQNSGEVAADCALLCAEI